MCYTACCSVCCGACCSVCWKKLIVAFGVSSNPDLSVVQSRSQCRPIPLNYRSLLQKSPTKVTYILQRSNPTLRSQSHGCLFNVSLLNKMRQKRPNERDQRSRFETEEMISSAVCCSVLHTHLPNNTATFEIWDWGNHFLGWHSKCHRLGCLTFIDHFPQKSPINSGSFTITDWGNQTEKITSLDDTPSATG